MILIVEDNPADAALMVAAFGRVSPEPELVAVEDAEAALSYLRRRGHYRDAKRPRLVIADSHLPGMTGRELLIEMRASFGLRSIPVVLISSSLRPQDVIQFYLAGANGVVEKPRSFDGYLALATSVAGYWCAANVTAD